MMAEIGEIYEVHRDRYTSRYPSRCTCRYTFRCPRPRAVCLS